MTTGQAQVRDMLAGDLQVVKTLLEQLGYDVKLDDVQFRFRSIIGSNDHALLVAELGGRMTGFLHIFARPALEKPHEAVVQSLVVDATIRRTGTGSVLMAEAEGWAVNRGFSSVALSSEISRDDAHAFYARIGYRTTATSYVLRKDIRPQTSNIANGQ